MYKININDIPKRGINRSYMNGISIRYLIVEEFGAPNFYLQRGSVTSVDRHDYEHEVFMRKGKGMLELEGEEYGLTEGDALLIEPNERHRLKQTGERPFGFLCIVPNGVSKSKQQVDLGY